MLAIDKIKQGNQAEENTFSKTGKNHHCPQCVWGKEIIEKYNWFGLVVWLPPHSSTPSSSSQDGPHLQLLSKLFLYTFSPRDFTVFLQKFFQFSNAFPLESFSCCQVSLLHREYREKLDYFLAASFYVHEDYYQVLAQASPPQLFPVGHLFQSSHALYCSPQYLHWFSHFVLEAFPEICLAAEALQAPFFSRVPLRRPYWCLIWFLYKNYGMGMPFLQW